MVSFTSWPPLITLNCPRYRWLGPEDRPLWRAEISFYLYKESNQVIQPIDIPTELPRLYEINLNLGVKRGLRVRLTTLSPFMSPLSGKCGNLDVSQPYRPPPPVSGIALFFYFQIIDYSRKIIPLQLIKSFLCL
jgi:hypothetical protein